jgi:hypothetical protein
VSRRAQLRFSSEQQTKSFIRKSPIGWRVVDVSDGPLAVSRDL